LTAGLLAEGSTVFLVGPLPTPAVAHITRSFADDAGIMITASHNPAEHNGIKIFDSKGLKLADELELELERHIADGLAEQRDGESSIGKARRIDDARGRYIEFAKSTIGNASLTGLKVVLDCANGAAYSITPTILQELGAEVIVLHNEPDGSNINKGCGALHPEVVSDAVHREKADIGIALDGDADRVILVDENGAIVDGDHILAILALNLQKEGLLKGPAVVGTHYTNMGLDEALAKEGIEVIRTDNGDRYVLEQLRTRGLNLGGEQSGHIILFDHATTGDGTLAALHVLKIMRSSGRALSELAAAMTSWPQRTESRKVREKRPFDHLPKVREAVTAAEHALAGNGRLLVRYSGTEKKVRIMVEAKDAERIEPIIRAIEEAFTEEGL